MRKPKNDRDDKEEEEIAQDESTATVDDLQLAGHFVDTKSNTQIPPACTQYPEFNDQRSLRE